MNPLLKPIGIGVLGFVLSYIGFWFGFTVLVNIYEPAFLLWYGFFVVGLPLLIAGYLAACFALSRHLWLRIVVGSVIGAVCAALLASLTMFGGKWWLTVIYVFCAGIWSGFGAIAGALTNSYPSGELE
ncbi:MAG: hypothetical protein AAGL69_07160 [Pseudomonadota bacterium]